MPTKPPLTTLDPAAAVGQLVQDADADWTRRFFEELEHHLRRQPLERLTAAWGLSNAAAAAIFGVSRQAFAKWLTGEPPAERAAAIADLAAATELLARYVKSERIPAVVRRPADALGGRSLLDLANEGRYGDVLDAVRAIFDLRRVQP